MGAHMGEVTVTKGERFYTVAVNGIVVAQSPVAQGAADYLWAMRMKARWMLYHEEECPHCGRNPNDCYGNCIFDELPSRGF
jgi:hypothetical protein